MQGWRRGFWVVAAIALASCSLGDGQERADRVTAAAVRTATELGPLAGTIDAELHVQFDDDVDPAQLGGLGIGGGADAEAGGLDLGSVVSGGAFTDRVSARMYIDPDERRALLGPVGESRFPVVHFTDTVVALRRPDADDTARPWLAVGLSDLDDGSGSIQEDTFDGPSIAAGILSLLDPRLLLDLAAGPLAGSIDAGVADQLPGGTRDAEVMRYEANFDIPRVLEDERDESYDDDRLEVVETVLDLVNIERDVNPGTVWIRRGPAARWRIEADDFVAFELDLSLSVEPTSTPDPDFELPTRDEAVRVDSLLPIARAAAEATAPEGMGALIGG